MKLLLFISSLGSGGAERVTALLTAHWAAAGWEVVVVTLDGATTDHYTLHPSIRRIPLGLLEASGGAWSAIIANVRRVLVLRRVLRAEHPQAAVAMMDTPSVLLAFAGLGLSEIFRVGTERIHPPRYPLPRMWNRLRSLAYRWLDVVVVQTGVTGAWVLAHTSARRVEVIPNPVVFPLPVMAPHRLPASVGTPGRKRLLATGRLDPQKGFDLLIAAFAQVAPTHPDWELIVLGEGSERSRLQAEIDRCGLGASVVLAGATGNPGDWYAAADLFAMSSRFEGFPNVLVEAMAHGLAVVSFACETGPAEIIRPEVDGLLVPAEDVSALAAALGRAMDDEPMRARLAARATEVRERFALSKIHEQWRQLLEAAG